MKKLNKFNKKLTSLFNRYLNRACPPISDPVSQKILINQYRADELSRICDFRDVGFRVYSQHDEDGILLYIFAKIGVSQYRAVEMCAGNGIECNTANLILNHRWNALLIDGNANNIQNAKRFYNDRAETKFWPPEIVEAWLTRENVNRICEDAGYCGEVDLLSLDVDGVDYWLLEAINIIVPRVIVLEYNHLLGPTLSLTVPYRPDFVAELTKYGSDYAGASISAFIKLCGRKGYRFLGTNTIGTNAFFIRNDIANELLPEANPCDAFHHPRAQFGMNVRFPGIKDKPWIEVE